MKTGLNHPVRFLSSALLSVVITAATVSAQVTHPRALQMGEAPAIVSGGQFVAGPNPYPGLLTDQQHQEVGRLSYYLFRRDLRRASDWVARHDDPLGDLGRGVLLMVRLDGEEMVAAQTWDEVVGSLRARHGTDLARDDAWGWMVRGYGDLFVGWRAATTGHSWRARWWRFQARRAFLRVKRLAPDFAEADLGIALLLEPTKPALARRFLDHAAEHSVYVAPFADLVRVAWATDAGEPERVAAVAARYALSVVHSPFLLAHVGDAYLELGRPREAGEWYQRLSFELSSVGWPKLKVAEAQAAQAEAERSEFWQQRMRREAKSSYEGYLATRDRDPVRRARAYVELGGLEVADGHPAVARRYYRLALKSRPGDAAATTALAALEAK